MSGNNKAGLTRTNEPPAINLSGEQKQKFADTLKSERTGASYEPSRSYDTSTGLEPIIVGALIAGMFD